MYCRPAGGGGGIVTGVFNGDSVGQSTAAVRMSFTRWLASLLWSHPRGDRVAPPPHMMHHLDSGAEFGVGGDSATPIAAAVKQPAVPTSAPEHPSDAPAAPQAPARNLGRELVKALKKGDAAAVGSLMDEDASLLERRGMWENTPLLVACHYGHGALALMLLDRGADAAATNEAGVTPLLFACVESMAAVVEKLLTLSSVVVEPPAAMVYARATDKTAARTPLQAAAENGFHDGLLGLLARGASADVAALTFAAAQGHATCCEALLPALLPVGTALGETDAPWLSEALAAAAARGHEAAVRALCAHPPARAAVSLRGGAAVRATCALRNSEQQERVLACLCEAGAPADYVLPDGDATTGLHLAASKGREAVVRQLLSAGADPGRVDSAGDTPAEVARRAGHADVAALLGEQLKRSVVDAEHPLPA